MVHYGIDKNGVIRDAVVNAEWKHAGDQSMEFMELAVMSMMKNQRVDIGADGIQKILADARLLALVENIAFEEILLGMIEDYDFHTVLFRNSFLT